MEKTPLIMTTQHEYSNNQREDLESQKSQKSKFVESGIEDEDAQIYENNRILLAELEGDQGLSSLLEKEKKEGVWSKIARKCKIHVDLHHDIGTQSAFSRGRKRLGRFIESRGVQWAILGLIIFDVLVLTTELLLERSEKGKDEDTAESHRIHKVEAVLKYTSWSILFVFAIEVFILLLAFGWRFFTHPLYVIDLLIVTAAIIVEVIFHEEFSGYLVILRLWRLLRIVHGIVTTLEERHSEQVKRESLLKKRVLQLKHQLSVTNTKLIKSS
eukprot:TRINITY_DN12792_c0_g1_i2.p1 TRINITY_DN12792_c0_g1~~TRINITY_DN12792_c0_g1_i2.p1  ORF type:complete len:271 (+),score=70.86 TRINITY_DN12792_c0_g1_i2:16-828(+)